MPVIIRRQERIAEDTLNSLVVLLKNASTIVAEERTIIALCERLSKPTLLLLVNRQRVAL